ncbi:MAG: hypothetical protein IJO61_00085 [Oscillospiraceae bacterium]|nr:hypothetical protein [Oscillospiraceae bacterium]MBQ7120390.1 hypothetical protein [Oscillospiraceae bacterium]
MEIVTIKSSELEVKIKTFGAELTSIRNKSGREFLWQGGKEWKDQALVLFPIVSGLKDDKYTFNGKEYHMEAHGFASAKQFEVEELSENSATLLLRSDDETRAQYPFDFEFRVRFTVDGVKLLQEYITDNKSGYDMYYSAGSHEGLATSGRLDNYSIIFDENETISRYSMIKGEDGRVLGNVPCLENQRELKLSHDKYFYNDELIFLDFKSKGLTFRDDRNGESIHIDFPDQDTLVCWSKGETYAEFLCIEPWCGTWDFEKYTPCDFSKKYRIRTLKPDEREILTHTITFF